MLQPRDQAGFLRNRNNLAWRQRLPLNFTAHQGLGGLDAAVEIDDGLVVQRQAARFQRRVDLALDEQFFAGEQDADPSRHLLVTRNDVTPPTQTLRLEHRAIGAFNQGQGFLGVIEHGHADATGRPHAYVADFHRHGDRAEQFFGDLLRPPAVAGRHQKDELVASHPRGFGTTGHGIAEASGHHGDHRIAAEMAKGLIDLLESVQIRP